MPAKKQIESALRELRFARCNPENCEGNHSEEYKNYTGYMEHSDFHIDNAISILEDLAKK